MGDGKIMCICHDLRDFEVAHVSTRRENIVLTFDPATTQYNDEAWIDKSRQRSKDGPPSGCEFWSGFSEIEHELRRHRVSIEFGFKDKEDPEPYVEDEGWLEIHTLSRI